MTVGRSYIRKDSCDETLDAVLKGLKATDYFLLWNETSLKMVCSVT
jgi:hypothetical protein